MSSKTNRTTRNRLIDTLSFCEKESIKKRLACGNALIVAAKKQQRSIDEGQCRSVE